MAVAQEFKSGPAVVPMVELYTSEGCSSCPPADEWLGKLRLEPGLWRDFVPVAFHVNYWDRLGWKDALASPGYTDRQYAYSQAWGAGGRVYTPGFVWAGREWRPGQPAPRAAISEPGVLTANRLADGTVSIRFVPAVALVEEGRLRVQVALLGGGVVTKVKSGENAGRDLTHEFVVLYLESVELVADGGGALVASVGAPPAGLPEAPRYGLAAWVSRRSEPQALQSVGGWLR